MFGSLRHSSGAERIEFIDQTPGFLRERAQGSTKRASCDRCRVKKVRCSGNPDRCALCRRTDQACVYSATKDNRRIRQRRAPQHESEAFVISAKPKSTPRTSSSSPGVTLGGQSTVGSNDSPNSTSSGSAEGSLQPKDQTDGLGPAPFENTAIFNPEIDLTDTFIDEGTADYALDFLEDPASLQGLPLQPIDHAQDNAFTSLGLKTIPTSAPTWAAGTFDFSNPVESMFGARFSAANSTMTTKDAIQMPLCPPQPVQLGCKCFSFQVAILEELSSPIIDLRLDEALIAYKDLLRRCSAVLSCNACMTRSESIMLLLLCYENVIKYCKAVVAACLGRSKGSRVSCPDASSGGLITYQTSFGLYQPDSPEEVGNIVGALALHHFNMLATQLTYARRPAAMFLKPHQALKLQACEEQVMALINMVHSGELINKPVAGMVLGDEQQSVCCA